MTYPSLSYLDRQLIKLVWRKDVLRNQANLNMKGFLVVGLSSIYVKLIIVLLQDRLHQGTLHMRIIDVLHCLRRCLNCFEHITLLLLLLRNRAKEVHLES